MSAIGKAVSSAVSFLAGGGVVGGLVTSALKSPKQPDMQPLIPMPDPLAQQQAKRRSIIEQTTRRGRASTIMTDASAGGDTLGG